VQVAEVKALRRRMTTRDPKREPEPPLHSRLSVAIESSFRGFAEFFHC
jgi:hypothetical protein